jgi:hypothetical protein
MSENFNLPYRLGQIDDAHKSRIKSEHINLIYDLIRFGGVTSKVNFPKDNDDGGIYPQAVGKTIKWYANGWKVDVRSFLNSNTEAISFNNKHPLKISIYPNRIPFWHLDFIRMFISYNNNDSTKLQALYKIYNIRDSVPDANDPLTDYKEIKLNMDDEEFPLYTIATGFDGFEYGDVEPENENFEPITKFIDIVIKPLDDTVYTVSDINLQYRLLKDGTDLFTNLIGQDIPDVDNIVNIINESWGKNNLEYTNNSIKSNLLKYNRFDIDDDSTKYYDVKQIIDELIDLLLAGHRFEINRFDDDNVTISDMMIDEDSNFQNIGNHEEIVQYQNLNKSDDDFFEVSMDCNPVGEYEDCNPWCNLHGNHPGEPKGANKYRIYYLPVLLFKDRPVNAFVTGGFKSNLFYRKAINVTLYTNDTPAYGYESNTLYNKVRISVNHDFDFHGQDPYDLIDETYINLSIKGYGFIGTIFDPYTPPITVDFAYNFLYSDGVPVGTTYQLAEDGEKWYDYASVLTMDDTPGELNPDTSYNVIGNLDTDDGSILYHAKTYDDIPVRLLYLGGGRHLSNIIMPFIFIIDEDVKTITVPDLSPNRCYFKYTFMFDDEIIDTPVVGGYVIDDENYDAGSTDDMGLIMYNVSSHENFNAVITYKSQEYPDGTDFDFEFDIDEQEKIIRVPGHKYVDPAVKIFEYTFRWAWTGNPVVMGANISTTAVGSLPAFNLGATGSHGKLRWSVETDNDIPARLKSQSDSSFNPNNTQNFTFNAHKTPDDDGVIRETVIILFHGPFPDPPYNIHVKCEGTSDYVNKGAIYVGTHTDNTLLGSFDNYSGVINWAVDYTATLPAFYKYNDYYVDFNLSPPGGAVNVSVDCSDKQFWESTVHTIELRPTNFETKLSNFDGTNHYFRNRWYGGGANVPNNRFRVNDVYNTSWYREDGNNVDFSILPNDITDYKNKNAINVIKSVDGCPPFNGTFWESSDPMPIRLFDWIATNQQAWAALDEKARCIGMSVFYNYARVKNKNCVAIEDDYSNSMACVGGASFTISSANDTEISNYTLFNQVIYDSRDPLTGIPWFDINKLNIHVFNPMYRNNLDPNNNPARSYLTVYQNLNPFNNQGIFDGFVPSHYDEEEQDTTRCEMNIGTNCGKQIDRVRAKDSGRSGTYTIPTASATDVTKRLTGKQLAEYQQYLDVLRNPYLSESLEYTPESQIGGNKSNTYFNQGWNMQLWEQNPVTYHLKAPETGLVNTELLMDKRVVGLPKHLFNRDSSFHDGDCISLNVQFRPNSLNPTGQNYCNCSDTYAAYRGGSNSTFYLWGFRVYTFWQNPRQD